MLTETVLHFDKGEITDEQIKAHVQHYVNLADEGMKHLNNNNRQEAMRCLKEIRKTMKEEYRYYDKLKVQKVMWKNEKYNMYYSFIRDAFVKQNTPNAYSTLSSNLYDVWDYGLIHCSTFIK
ncbi:hypothetical protein [Cytobacillus gottheilii]|uniref:hypothetical protein n=1 Tax=Cytobacillus gottheilii TaxID=859144 RepID=UPI0009B9E674|nr:hypothetical protein [Cytobacillus gottheilii]